MLVYCCLQVESFLLVLQPVLQAAGHSLTAAAIQAGSSSSSSTQQACSSGMHAKQPSPDQQGQCQTSYHCQQQQQQHFAAQPQPQPMKHPLSLHIVDFGCGSGNLLLPLAALLPGCQFTGVDMKPAALKLLMQRAADAGLSNVSVFEGMIEQYRQPFDVALALHACGNATDHVLQVNMADMPVSSTYGAGHLLALSCGSHKQAFGRSSVVFLLVYCAKVVGSTYSCSNCTCVVRPTGSCGCVCGQPMTDVSAQWPSTHPCLPLACADGC